MLLKSFDFAEIKSEESDEGLFFSGYASVFGIKDHHEDIVDHGAFTKTIQERMPKKAIKVLWQHSEPFGMPVQLNEDDKGLFVRAKVVDTPTNRERLAYMEAGVVDKMSIGYSVVKSSYDKDMVANRLKELKLYEVSPVTFPANEATSITELKHELNNIIHGNIDGVDVSLIDEAIKALQSLRKEIQPVETTEVPEKPTPKAIDSDIYQSLLKEIRGEL